MKIKGLRYYIAMMLMLVTMINYIDRTCFSLVAPILKSDLKINEQQFSYIIIMFQICYALMQPVCGRVIDWLNIRKGFSFAVIWWSIANILTIFAKTPLGFGISRGLLGIGEAGNFPGVAKTACQWFPAKERTMATGIANIGSGTGALIATPFVAWIIIKWGWQMAFVVTGAIGFLWVILWQILYRSPEEHKMITKQELAYIQLEGHEDIHIDPEIKNRVWAVALKARNFWAIAFARFLSEPAWQFFSYWIPMYLITQRGLNLKEIAMFAWIPFLAADIGSFVGGLLSPIYQKLGMKVLTSRKASMATAAIIMSMTVFIAWAPSSGWAIFWFCCGAFAHNMISATLLTLPADMFAKHLVATANGLTGTVAYFGGMLFTFLVGWIVTTYSTYTPAFIAIALFDVIGTAGLWLLLKENEIKKNFGLSPILEETL